MLNWDEYNTEETNQVAQKAPAQTKEEKEVIVKLEESPSFEATSEEGTRNKKNYGSVNIIGEKEEET